MEETIRELEQKLLDAEFRRSREKVAQLLADEFIEFGSSGRVYNKQQVLEALELEAPAKRQITALEVAELAPGVILATYQLTSRSETLSVHSQAAGFIPQVLFSLRSSIWRKSEAEWSFIRAHNAQGSYCCSIVQPCR